MTVRAEIARALRRFARSVRARRRRRTSTPPVGDALRAAVLLEVMDAVETWADLLPTPEVSGFITDYLLREFEITRRP